MDTLPAQAMIRFGLGRRGAEPLPADPLGWLATQLERPDPALAVRVASTAEGLIAQREDHDNPVPPGQKRRQHVLWEADSHTACRVLVETPAPFRERLVWFWANHFTVSLRRGDLHPIAVPYVWEAIRPHVTGRFVDMLMAVARHPAMLRYLDNADSFGPNSPDGIHQHRGLNENLARECLELHSVGADGGYAQRDVTAFANLLTGWGIGLPAPQPGFAFFTHRHQPGRQTVMGQDFPQGEAGGIAALSWLGNHPATFRHLAGKLVRHFVADAPAPADVTRITEVLRATLGSLKAAALELTRLASAWQAPLGKLRAPADYVVAAVRALDLPEATRPDLLGAMTQLGQPLLGAPLPNGWPDTGPAWLDGEMLLRRSDWALALAARRADLDPVAAAQACLGPLLREATLRAVQRAPSRREGLALLLASPEFNRR